MKPQLPQLEQAAKESADLYSRALEAWHQAEAATLPAAGELDTARNAYAEAKKKADEATKALPTSPAQQQTKQNIAATLQQAAIATRTAAEALPGDNELTEAAQKLLSKSEQLTAEATALAKTIEEKATALKPLTEALDAAKPPVDAAVAKLAPLKTAMLQAEQADAARAAQGGNGFPDARSARSATQHDSLFVTASRTQAGEPLRQRKPRRHAKQNWPSHSNSLLTMRPSWLRMRQV